MLRVTLGGSCYAAISVPGFFTFGAMFQLSSNIPGKHGEGKLVIECSSMIPFTGFCIESLHRLVPVANGFALCAATR